MPEAEADPEYTRACQQYEELLNEDEPAPKAPRSRLQAGEIHNMLRLATALKLLLATSVTDEKLDRGTALLREYILELDAVCTMQLLFTFSCYIFLGEKSPSVGIVPTVFRVLN